MLIYGCTRIEVGVQSIYEDGIFDNFIIFNSRKRYE